MNGLNIEKIFGDSVRVLFYIYDHQNEEIHKRNLKYDVMNNYNQLLKILDNLESEDLIKIHDDGKKHVVIITSKGCKFAEQLRLISNNLPDI